MIKFSKIVRKENVKTSYSLLKASDSDKKKTIPPRIHSADPAQPINRAAPNSYLRKRKNKALIFK